MAGDFALWIGPGRKVIEWSWQCLEFGTKLCGALADLDWGGWKTIALPSVLKMVPQLLENDSVLSVALLAALHRKGKLGELDLPCRTMLEAYLCARLTQWEKTEESVGVPVLSFGGVT